MLDAHKPVDVVRLRDGRLSAGVDRAATEEPLEVRLHGRPFAVIMRTPGADRELAAGFLFSEGVLKSADDLGTIEYCTDPSSVTPSTDHPIRPPNSPIVTPELKLGPTSITSPRDPVTPGKEGRRRGFGLHGAITLLKTTNVRRSTAASMPRRSPLRIYQAVRDVP